MDSITEELNLSPHWAIFALTLMAVALVWQSDHPSMDVQRTQHLAIALGVYGICGLAWMAARHHHQRGQLAALGLVWLGFQIPLFFSTFPTAIAMAAVPSLLILYALGRKAAAGTAVLQALLAGAAWQIGWLEGAAAGQIIVGTSIVLSIAGVAHYHFQRVAHELWQQYLDARAALHAARERNMLLDQTKDDLVHANRQLVLLNERLAALRAHAEEVEAGKTTFITKVSHEFRSPLNMIIGLADLLMDAPNVYGSRLPAPLMQDIQILHRNCIHLTAMINDVLDLSQTEAGRLTLHMDWENLDQEIRIAVENVTPLFARKGLQLHVNIPTPFPAVYCDRTRVRQVLLNLLTNAGRYTDDGSVTVTATQKEQSVCISIADTGPGIAPVDQARIFEPFYQSTDVIANTSDGSGLGLSICKQFVELHRGRLWLESEVDQGTVFHVELPIAPPQPAMAASYRWFAEDWPWHARENRGQLPTLPARLRVVLYDETGQLEHYMAGRADEIECIQAHSIADAVHAVSTTPAHLLLLNTASTAALPLLMGQVQAMVQDTIVVGSAFPAQVEHILRAGAMDYLIKPVTRVDLVQTLTAFEEPIKRILLVDDDTDFQNLLCRMLQAYDPDLIILTANNGQQALAVMADAQPDLVLLDLMMPVLDGWQVLAQKEEDATLRTIPVVVLSSQDPSTEHPMTEWVTIGWNQGLSFETALRSAIGAATSMTMGTHELISGTDNAPHAPTPADVPAPDHTNGTVN